MVNVSELQAYFPQFESALLQELAQVAEVKTFAEGETLMRTGQYIKTTMLILDGLVKVYREDEEGAEFFMYHLDKGKACALSLICALKQERSEVMARTDRETTVLSIPFTYMDQWMMRYRSWYQFVLGSYRDRFEELLQVVDHIAFRNMDERLVFYLKRHQQQQGCNMLPLTHTGIAQELNSSREVITRLLKKLAERGMVKVHRQAVEIINLEL